MHPRPVEVSEETGIVKPIYKAPGDRSKVREEREIISFFLDTIVPSITSLEAISLMEAIHFIIPLESPVEFYNAFYGFNATIFRITERKLELNAAPAKCSGTWKPKDCDLVHNEDHAEGLLFIYFY